MVHLINNLLIFVSDGLEDTQVEMVLAKKDETWCVSLCHMLNEMRQSSCFSDVVIRADNGHVFTSHTCILAAASPVLKTHLLSSPHYLDVPKICKRMWEVLLQFIYTGNLEIQDASEIPSILETGKLLQLTEVISLCEDLLMDNMQKASCVTKTYSVSNRVGTRSRGKLNK